MFEFKFLFFIIILIKSSLYVDSCILAKKNCDCSFAYAIASDEPKKLFDLASIEDCGINLTCNEMNCAERCLNSMRKVLGRF